MLRPDASPSLWLPSASGGHMASSSQVPESKQPENRTEHFLHLLCCSDPDCAYCKDLRAAEQQWKRERDEKKNADAA
jgi:hypothetical protein